MKILLEIIQKFIGREKKYSSFSDFILTATEAEKIEVIQKAAEESNKQQRALLQATNLGVQ